MLILFSVSNYWRKMLISFSSPNSLTIKLLALLSLPRSVKKLHLHQLGGGGGGAAIKVERLRPGAGPVPGGGGGPCCQPPWPPPQ